TSKLTLTDLEGSDDFSATDASGTYNSANVAAATTVSTTLIAGDFTAGATTTASNYSLPTSASGPGHITAKSVTASIVNDPTKGYEIGSASCREGSNFSLSGLVGTDAFTVTKASGTYNSASVATATTVSTSLIAGDFTAGATTTANNYSLPTTASGPGHITAKSVTASIVNDPTKGYDATDAATLAAGNFSLSGRSGDHAFTVTVTSGTYKTATAAT